MTQNRAGKVWLIGAGPGDPELLTVKALRLIQQADLILFDHLISDEIRALFPKHIPAFYVGKKKGAHSITQKSLNALMVKKAKEGKHIARVKCGDPFIFGRGGEELLELLEAHIEAEVVPGVTSASGCATYAGIPLTHRGLSQGCTFVTGHGETALNLNWPALVAAKNTLVFYMGLTNAALIQSELSKAGMDASMPVAVIENGCRDNQRIGAGRLSELMQLIERERFISPSLIVIGETVSLAGQLTPVVHHKQDMSLVERLSA